jgi:hypothetical protein
VKPDCPCSLEVDDQLEFRRLLYRKTGGTSEAKNFVDVDGGTAIKVGVVRPIRDQPSGIDVLLRDIDCVRIAPTAAAFPTPRLMKFPDPTGSCPRKSRVRVRALWGLSGWRGNERIGLSTGPKTTAGRAKIVEAPTSISWPMPNGLTPCRWDIRRPPDEHRQRRKLSGNVRRVLSRNST